MRFRIPSFRARSLDKSRTIGRLAHGVSWSVTGQVAQRALAFLTTIVIARLLGTTGFGELGMVQSSVAMFGVMAGFGLGSTTAKYVAQWRTSQPDRACRVISITAISALVMAGLFAVGGLVASDWLAARVLLQDRLAGPLRIGCLLFFVSTLDSVAVATLRGFESFRRLAIVNICRGVLTPVVAVPLVYFWGIGGAIAALVVNAILGLALTVHMVGKACQEAQLTFRFGIPPWREWAILWQFSLPATVAGILVVPPAWLGRALLARQPDGYTELGFYSAANQWLLLMIFIPSVVGTVLMPVIASSRDTDPDRRAELFRTPLLLTGLVSLVLVGLSILLCDHVLALYGRDFSSAKPVFIVTMVAAWFAALNQILYQSLLGMGAPYLRLLASVVRACVFIACIFFLVPSLLALGLALSRLVAAAVYLAVQLPVYRYRVGLFQRA